MTKRTDMMKRLTLSLLALSSLSATGFANAADDKKAGPAKPALSVTTTRPTRISVPIQLSANGNITAWQEAVIGSESNGLRLTDVQVNVGD